MKNVFPRALLLFALGACCLPVFAAVALAGDPVNSSATILQANVILEYASDRTRLIQISLVFVTVGIGLLWWNR